jgi:hypothetical protein
MNKESQNRLPLSRSLTPIALAAVVMIFPGSLKGVTLVNGSFEDLSAPFFSSPGGDIMSNVAADGWTVATNSPDWFYAAPGPGALWSTDWGDYFTMGAASGTYREGVSQTVTGMTVGQNYEIAFHQANGLLFEQGSYVGTANVGGWEVFLDGISVLSSPSLNDNSTSSLDFPGTWSTGSVIFEATAASQTLEFRAYDIGTGPTMQFLDNVTINATQIPEPSAVLLIALSGAGILVQRRRSR